VDCGAKLRSIVQTTRPITYRSYTTRALALFATLWSVVVGRGDVFLFQERSEPQGIFPAWSAYYSSGTTNQTVNAPITSAGYGFANRTINGQRVADILGQSMALASFVISNETVAIAWYLPTSEDSDLDSIPDYLELRHYGSVTGDSDTETDGDGFKFAEEISRGYNPVIRDRVSDGGVMMRMSESATFRDSIQKRRLEIRSSPAGLITPQIGYFDDGTMVTTPSIPAGASNGYRFGYWAINAVRQSAASGLAVSLVTITMTNDVVAIAHFVPSGDSDVDTLEDWFELYWFGNLDQSSASDPDDDSYTVMEEMFRGYSPVVADEVADGGVMMRLSEPGTFRDSMQKKRFEIRSDPQGIIASQISFVDMGTVVSTPTIPYGISANMGFIWWEVNGVRQSAASGLALLQVTLTMTTDVVAVARFVQRGDADLDQLEDWYELHWFGNLDQTSTSDSDGDSLSVANELSRGYSSVINDRLSDGGLVMRMSEPGTFRDSMQKKRFEIRSSPQGLITAQIGFSDTGTPVTTPTIPLSANNGYHFGFWEVNGVRQSAASGLALSVVTLPMTNDVVAIAQFFPGGDADSDGLNDWFEWYWFGNLLQSPASDPDGDMLKVMEELTRGYSPVIEDRLSDGGMVMRLSEASTVVLNGPWFYSAQSMEPYVSRATNSISFRIVWPADRQLQLLYCRPVLPPGWSLISVAGDGGPEMQSGEIIFTALTLPNPLQFVCRVAVPDGEVGTKSLSATVMYLMDGMDDVATVNSSPDPLVVLPAKRHSADFQTSAWTIDGLEVSRVLAYWRRQSYHIQNNAWDGYAVGPGSTNGIPHSADFRSPFWIIDGTEINRVLAHWRAGAYHPNASGVDGYAPGPLIANENDSNSSPITDLGALWVIQSSSDLYVPGSLVNVTNKVEYIGEPLALLLRPKLPIGWAIESVSGLGNPQWVAGEVVWTGAIPPSPFELVCSIQVQAGDSNPQQLQQEVEYYMRGMINPEVAFATPNVLQFATSKLGAVVMQGNQIQFHLFGEIGRRYSIQSSTDLMVWTNVATVTITSGVAQLTASITEPNRFYRALLNE
jgi:hypothetical protein